MTISLVSCVAHVMPSDVVVEFRHSVGVVGQISHDWCVLSFAYGLYHYGMVVLYEHDMDNSLHSVPA